MIAKLVASFSQGTRGIFFQDMLHFWNFSFSSLWSHYQWSSLLIDGSTLFKLVLVLKLYFKMFLHFISKWFKNAQRTAVGEGVLTKSFNIHIFSVFESIRTRLGASGSSFPVEIKLSYDRSLNLHSLCTRWGMYDTILII